MKQIATSIDECVINEIHKNDTKWLRRASQGHKWTVHDLEVMGLNADKVELGAHKCKSYLNRK